MDCLTYCRQGHRPTTLRRHADIMTIPSHTTTLIYDGACRFCRRGMQWFAARATDHRLAFVARDSSEQRTRFPQANDARYAGVILCIDAHGTIHAGHAAIACALRILPQQQYRCAGHLLDVPLVRPFARLGYALLAKYRQRITCRNGACGA